jgi:hypothetical protein
MLLPPLVAGGWSLLLPEPQRISLAGAAGVAFAIMFVSSIPTWLVGRRQLSLRGVLAVSLGTMAFRLAAVIAGCFGSRLLPAPRTFAVCLAVIIAGILLLDAVFLAVRTRTRGRDHAARPGV